MENAKLIHDFMDGNLDVGQEEQMFYEFSSNEELRSELKQQIAIREAIRNDSRAYTPAASSTVGVFSALGFTPPSTVTVPVSAIGKGGMLSLLTKYKQGLISGVATLLTTAAIFLLLINPMINPVNKNANSGKSTIIQSQVIPNNVPKVESFSADNQKPQVRYITKYRYVDIPRYIDKQNEQIGSENQNTEFSSTELSANDLSSNSNIELTSSNLANTETPKISQKNLNDNFYHLNQDVPGNRINSLLFTGEPIGLSAEIRGTQYWNINKEYIMPSYISKFNNTAVALYYNIFDDLALGAEVRQENFYQKYESPKGDTIFQQQPNFTSYGLNMRFTLPYKVWVTEPFIQLGAGFNNAGYTGRVMAGLKYTPYRDITIVIGGEFSGLRYYHNNNWFTTGKYGFNYGIMYNF